MTGRIEHGMSESKEYNLWRAMKDRCANVKNKRWNRYGGRGIKVCKRWMKFENFYADMGEKPYGMTLERIDNNGNYEPSNCRWATHKEQCRNRISSPLIEFNGSRKCIKDWADWAGLKPATLRARLKVFGWSIERSLRK